MSGRRALGIAAFIVVAAAPIWCYLGGPPLTGKSDGRYAAVSRDVADHDHWLAPRLGERLHLTKPPLTYWAEAACIEALGATEFAVRAPSAIAGSALLLAVLAMGWRVGGRRVALLSAGVLAVMPMHVVVSRLTLTDGLLQLWWFATLAGAFMAVRQPMKLRWPLVLWAAVALGWLTKGPIALIPVALVVAWLGLGRRWREVRSLRPVWGFVLSLVPVAAWFITVVTQVPGAWTQIEAELSAQAGGGTHASGSLGQYLLEVVYYYPGLVLVTMFPATAMLNVPPVNYSMKAAWGSLREGRDAGLWAVAAVGPLIIFSLSPSKLPAYITPVGAPLALLTGLMLDGWLSGRHDDPPAGYRPPEVRRALAVVFTLGAIGAAATLAHAGMNWLFYSFPLFAAVAAGWFAVLTWSDRSARAGAMARVWIALVACCLWTAVSATLYLDSVHPRLLLSHARERLPGDDMHVVTFDYTDNALSFYHGRYVPRLDNPQELLSLARRHRQSLVVFADAGDWRETTRRRPALKDDFRVVLEVGAGRPLVSERLILLPVPRGDYDASPERSDSDS